MWGFIDENGNEVIEPRFDLADVFSEGLCAVESEGQEFCISHSGEKVLGGGELKVGRFEDGFADVEVNGLFGLIDHRGEFLIAPKFPEVIGGFREGLAPMKYSQLYGYVDRTGETVIEPRFEFAKSFSHGLAEVTFPGSFDWWYINQAGDPILGPYRQAAKFHDGLALVTDDVGPAYINTAGRVRHRFDQSIEPFNRFSWGLAGAFRRDTSGERLGMGFINKAGEWVVDPSFDHAHAFDDNGLAEVKRDNRFGLIDSSGRVVVPLEYETMSIWPHPYITPYIKVSKGATLSAKS